MQSIISWGLGDVHAIHHQLGDVHAIHHQLGDVPVEVLRCPLVQTRVRIESATAFRQGGAPSV